MKIIPFYSARRERVFEIFYPTITESLRSIYTNFLFLASTFPFLNECVTLANCMVDIVVHGKATSNLIQDIDQGVILADTCRDVTLQCIDLYSNYQTRSFIKLH
jgi:hypothetical protein